MQHKTRAAHTGSIRVHSWSVIAALCASVFVSFGLPAKAGYFPPPESSGGWRKLQDPDAIRQSGGMDPARLIELREWLLHSDTRDFAAVVIRHGWIVLEVESGKSSKTNTGRVASVSKAVCATVLAIASEQSQRGLTPGKMTFDDLAFAFIPWAQPLRFKIEAQSFSLGWELPALLGGEGIESGKGIPADARYKPGSGGQLIAFVPSLDLVITRQTGSSGDWAYQDYLRRACAAAMGD